MPQNFFSLPPPDLLHLLLVLRVPSFHPAASIKFSYPPFFRLFSLKRCFIEGHPFSVTASLLPPLVGFGLSPRALFFCAISLLLSLPPAFSLSQRAHQLKILRRVYAGTHSLCRVAVREKLLQRVCVCVWQECFKGPLL